MYIIQQLQHSGLYIDDLGIMIYGQITVQAVDRLPDIGSGRFLRLIGPEVRRHVQLIDRCLMKNQIEQNHPSAPVRMRKVLLADPSAIDIHAVLSKYVIANLQFSVFLRIIGNISPLRFKTALLQYHHHGHEAG